MANSAMCTKMWYMGTWYMRENRVTLSLAKGFVCELWVNTMKGIVVKKYHVLAWLTP